MSTRVFLVRHGGTALSTEDRFAGAIEVPLSEVGREQGRRLAERLAKNSFAAIYASPLGRAMETARILAAPHGLRVSPLAALGEIAHGCWEGMTRAEVRTMYADEFACWEEDPYTFAPKGGETGLAVTARALPALLDIVKTHQDANVVVVSHKATLRLLVSALLGFDPRRYRDRLKQSLAALSIVEFRDAAHARLALFNDTSRRTMKRPPRRDAAAQLLRQEIGDGDPSVGGPKRPRVVAGAQRLHAAVVPAVERRR